MPYATYVELEARYPSLSGQSTTEETSELTAASSFIDGHCNRTFGLEDAATIRYFPAPRDLVELDLGPFEIGTTTDLVIAVDDGTNTYGTTLTSTEYQLEPVNAVYASPDPRPFTCIRRIDAYWPYAVSRTDRQERIKVTARYGWPAVPEPVKRSCMALANNAFENPTGVRSEAIDGYSVSYQAANGQVIGVPPSILAALRPYVRGWAA